MRGCLRIAAGLRSEYNSDVFANLNIQVIEAGIGKRRNEYYSAILKSRSCSIKEYPLEEAIKDAFVFHSYCSLPDGLEEANLSIQQAQHPGLDSAIESLQKIAPFIPALKNISAVSSSPAQGTPVIGSFSMSPTTQRVSGTCELPVPGSPKGSVQGAVKPLTVAIQSSSGSNSGSVSLPFTDAADPAASLAKALVHFSTTSSDLDAKLGKIANSAATQQVLDAETTKDSQAVAAIHVVGMNGGEKKVTAGEALQDYYTAMVKLQGSSKDDDVRANRLLVTKAQAVNAEISAQIAGYVQSFDKVVEATNSFIATHQPAGAGK